VSKQNHGIHSGTGRSRAAPAPHRVLALLAVAALAIAMPAPALAQGLFDFLFRPPSRPAPPPSTSSYADPSDQPELPRHRTRGNFGRTVAYCVRLCDGRYFPIQRSGSATPAEICSSFCPASPTKLFSGSGIEHAVARDGSHYADLGQAFAYRDKTVPDCTCNGRDAFGLAQIRPAEDPTLRQGDVVATDNGFVTYNGGRRGGDFTPIDSSHSDLSAQWRRQLSQTQIAPDGVSTATAPTTDGLSRRDDRHAHSDR
jgi:hypothetical protein